MTRAGNDFSWRSSIVMAVAKLPVQSCIIDGEAIMCDDNGLAVFELIRQHRTSATAVHCAFDLELDGEDLPPGDHRNTQGYARQPLTWCAFQPRVQPKFRR